MEVVDDFREVRRIAVEESFFLEHKLEVGEGIKCTVCKGIVDITHPAYVKHQLCNNCWEPYNKNQQGTEGMPESEITDIIANRPSARHVILSCQTCRKLKKHREIKQNLYQCIKCRRHVDLR
ncbi:hypothetical protein V7157_27945 [Neobacillus drentensis]|uniref:hypothetical protein n=1 Tax=Neobacillus drentensis TaxID=220684 RepID=UPI00300301C6